MRLSVAFCAKPPLSVLQWTKHYSLHHCVLKLSDRSYCQFVCCSLCAVLQTAEQWSEVITKLHSHFTAIAVAHARFNRWNISLISPQLSACSPLQPHMQKTASYPQLWEYVSFYNEQLWLCKMQLYHCIVTIFRQTGVQSLCLISALRRGGFLLQNETHYFYGMSERPQPWKWFFSCSVSLCWMHLLCCTGKYSELL